MLVNIYIIIFNDCTAFWDIAMNYNSNTLCFFLLFFNLTVPCWIKDSISFFFKFLTYIDTYWQSLRVTILLHIPVATLVGFLIGKRNLILIYFFKYKWGRIYFHMFIYYLYLLFCELLLYIIYYLILELLFFLLIWKKLFT